MSLSGLEDDPAKPIRWQMLPQINGSVERSGNNWKQVPTGITRQPGDDGR
jgi:hypothetical protein